MKHHHSLTGDRSSFFVLLVMSAMLTLLASAGGLSWLTEGLVSDIGGLLLMWLSVTFVLNLIFSALLRRLDAWFWSVFVKDAAAPVGEEAGAAAEESAAPEDPPLVRPGDEKLLRYLALRTTLQWHYRADPYQEGGDDVADNYRPADLVLSRHAYEKLAAWAERNGVSLSDAAERMLLKGMADEHLANIIREDGWDDDWPEEGA